jgi:hypothetical protein
MLLLAWRFRAFAYCGPMAATFSLALLANAFVCGVLSNPHDRYGARIVWIATLAVAAVIARAIPALRTRPLTTPAPTGASSGPAPAFSFARRKRR